MIVRGLFRCCLLALATLGPAAGLAAPRARQDTPTQSALPSPAGTLFRGTRFATPYYVIDSGRPGPTVLVIAGIHGNEPAPPVAAKQLLDWRLRRGRMVVLPEANRPALAARTRFTPAVRHVDLNRNFPDARHGLRGECAPELWRFVEQLAPSLVLDLHEGWGFHRSNPKSVGSSVTYVHHAARSTAARAWAQTALTAVNATIDQSHRRLTLITPGPAASIARAVSERMGIPTLVLETTRVGQTLALRVSQQVLMVRAVLADLKMLSR